MLYYKKYIRHEHSIIGKRKKYDTTIYTFDIETSSYLKLNNKTFAEITFIPKHADKRAVSKILQIVSEKAKNKESISARDIIDGKYLVSSVNNNGEYIYISPTPISV